MAEYVSPSLDLFSNNPYQLAITETEEEELSPLSTLDLQNSVEFLCHGYASKMKMLDEMYLSCTVQLTKADGSLYAETDALQGYLANGILTSLFKNCSVYFNQTLVYNVNQDFNFINFIQDSLNFSEQAVGNKLSNQGFFTNDQADKLKLHVKNSKVVELYSKLNLINCAKFLVPNCSLGLKLGFATSDFFIVEQSQTANDVTTTSSSKLIVKDIKLYVKHAVLRETYLLHLETSLAKGVNAVYEFKYPQIVTSTIPANQSSISVSNVFNGIRPCFVLAGFIPNKDYNGSRSSDPMKFSRHGLKSFNFILNGQRTPKKSYEFVINDQESKYARAFNSLYSSLGLAHENTSNLVNRDNFLTDYCFMCCDLTANGNGLSSLNDPLEMVTVGFDAAFDAPLANSLTAIIYVLLPRKVEVQAGRTVNVVY